MNCTVVLPETLSLEKKTLYILISIIIGVTAVFGNALLLLAVVKTQRLRTVSNYFICSLAMADFLVGLLVVPLNALRVLLPITTTSTISELLCLQTLVATTMNLAAVSIDRYIAVVKPLHYTVYLNERVTRIAISIIWVSSTLFSSTSLFIKGEDRTIFWLAATMITLFIPLGIIFYCYEEIRKVSRSHRIESARSSLGRPTSDTMLRHIKNHKASMTFFIITAVFLVSYAPSFISNIYYAVLSKPCGRLPEHLLWANLVMFVSSALNPVIYGARSRDYRMAFKKLMY